MDFFQLNNEIEPLDEGACKRAVDQWNNVAKPIGSLGVLEDIIVQIAGLTGSEHVDISNRRILDMCADNGVVAQGVTQSGQEVTALVAANMAKGISSVCQMGSLANATATAVDIGMVAPSDCDLVVDMHVMRGTNDMYLGPAMSRAQAEQGIQVGIDMVCRLKDEGVKIIVTGEMGIGNTTSSSAVAAVLTGLDVETVTGRGAGLSSAALERKIEVIKHAIELNQPDPNDALDVLAKVGGLDIAGIAGTFIGGALYRIPVLIDGVISTIAALIAAELCPASRVAMIPTHASAEPAALMVYEKLQLAPIIHAGMRLGEGTGAVCLLPMLDMALKLYSQGESFDDLGIDAYETDLK